MSAVNNHLRRVALRLFVTFCLVTNGLSQASHADWLAPVALAAALDGDSLFIACASAIRWQLLITLPVTTLAEACERIGWYVLRW